MPESKPVSVSQSEFDRLQKKLVPLWKSIEQFNQDPQTIVVVPSMSIDAIGSGTLMQAFEERFLFLLLLLRQPRARMIYVTSQMILPSIVDYYLDLLPGVIPSHARARLHLVALGIPMYGADPRFFHFGTKSGCRRLFAEEGIPHPLGEEGLTDL